MVGITALGQLSQGWNGTQRHSKRRQNYHERIEQRHCKKMLPPLKGGKHGTVEVFFVWLGTYVVLRQLALNLALFAYEHLQLKHVCVQLCCQLLNDSSVICFVLQIQIQCFVMERLAIGLGLFKVIKVLFGAVVLTKVLCVLHLLLLTSQRMVFLPFELPSQCWC